VIPLDYITEWRQVAPWIQDAQIEQDLVISRTPVHLFQNAVVSRFLAFRGGTALYKLYLTPPGAEDRQRPRSFSTITPDVVRGFLWTPYSVYHYPPFIGCPG
jgi:hypothetical protein